MSEAILHHQMAFYICYVTITITDTRIELKNIK